MVRVYEQIKMSVVFIIISKRIKKALYSVFIVDLGLNIVLSKLCSNSVPAIYALMGNHNSERCVYYCTPPGSLTQRVQIALFNTLATPKTFHMRHTVLLQGEPVKSPNRGQTF